jgi:hypothetical protein
MSLKLRCKDLKKEREKANRLHATLHRLCKHLPSDFEPYGKRSRDDDWGPDCSCGCKYFQYLQGNADWGVCCNPKSPRAGMLTFEHMGCKHFVEDVEATERLRQMIESQPGYKEKTEAFRKRAEAFRNAKRAQGL